MAYEFIKSPNFTPNNAVAANYGQPRTFKAIVIHWWDDPAKKPSISGVIQTFQNPQAQVSAHYVVNDSRTVQMVSEGDAAWHAKQANPFTIGVECDPNGGEAMYRRLGELVKDIRNRRGYLPLNKHSIYVQTSCPGTIDLSKIDNYANNQGGSPVASSSIVDETTIRLVYNGFLMRDANADEVKVWAGKTEEAFMREVLGSAEHQRILNYWQTKGDNSTLLKPGKYRVA
jgi:hypothetical protein